MPEPRRYVSADEDSGRWNGVVFRDGDVVISSRSKHGTTWLQMITLLLIHQTPELPAPLAELSPWLDHLVEPRETVIARLTAQPHRRVIKTHTPLDGIPLDPRVTYLVPARHPLDAAVSLYHHSANIDRHRLRQLVGMPPATSTPRPPLHEWLAAWIDHHPDPRDALDSLPGVLRHLSDAWARRTTDNVELIHYADLADDLDGQMPRLADRLGIAVPAKLWPALVHAAGFDQMRARAAQLAPDPVGILRDPAALFRHGVNGDATDVLTPSNSSATTAAPRRSHHPTCCPGSTGRQRADQAKGCRDSPTVSKRTMAVSRCLKRTVSADSILDAPCSAHTDLPLRRVMSGSASATAVHRRNDRIGHHRAHDPSESG